jgi:hypothetical protein
MDSRSPIWAVVKPRSFKKSMKIARLKDRLTKKVYKLYFQRFFLVLFISVPYLILSTKRPPTVGDRYGISVLGRPIPGSD